MEKSDFMKECEKEATKLALEELKQELLEKNDFVSIEKLNEIKRKEE